MAKPRILLAENDPSHRLLINSILGNKRYNIVDVSNGVEAVERFSEEDFDIVMLDIDMPLLNGFGAMAEIRKIKKEFSVPIILVTGKGGDSDDIALGLRSGADDFITKPFRTEELRARVEAWCRLSNFQREQIKQQRELAQFRLLAQVVITLSHYVYNAIAPISLLCQTTRPENEEKVREMIRVTKEQLDKIVGVVKSLGDIAQQTTIKTIEYPGAEEQMIDISETMERYLGKLKSNG